MYQPARRLRRTRIAGSSRKNGEAVVVDVSGPLVVDDADLMIRAAIDGLGLTFSFEEYVAPQIASGALVRAGRLVFAVRRLFSLLSASAATASRAVSSHRHASPVGGRRETRCTAFNVADRDWTTGRRKSPLVIARH